jgi:hypothetical protein
MRESSFLLLRQLLPGITDFCKVGFKGDKLVFPTKSLDKQILLEIPLGDSTGWWKKRGYSGTFYLEHVMQHGF